MSDGAFRGKAVVPGDPCAYITPSADQDDVIFLDHIVRVYVVGLRLTYVLTTGQTVPYTYNTHEECLKHLKTVADAKQRWDKYKAMITGGGVT